MCEEMISVIFPYLFSLMLVMPFRIIRCGKGRKLLNGGGGIECLLRCFKNIYIYRTFCRHNKIKLENCISSDLHVGEVMAVPTISYLLCDTNYPENTFVNI